MRKLIVFALAALTVLSAAPAMAGHDENPSSMVERYTYDVDAVPHPGIDNNEDVSGTIRITALPNNKVNVKVRLSGLSPNLPHAQHLHGDFAGDNSCPTVDDADEVLDDGLILSDEAVDDYGAIRVSLTVTGDTSPTSALALGRFPVADENGNLKYNRTFTVSDEQVLENLGVLHYVVHGIDIDNDGSYASETGPLGAPVQATIPTGCGGPLD